MHASLLDFSFMKYPWNNPNVFFMVYLLLHRKVYEGLAAPECHDNLTLNTHNFHKTTFIRFPSTIIKSSYRWKWPYQLHLIDKNSTFQVHIKEPPLFYTEYLLRLPMIPIYSLISSCMHGQILVAQSWVIVTSYSEWS